MLKKEGKSNFSIANFQCHVTLLHRIFTLMRGEHRELRDAKVMSDMKVRDYDVNAAQGLHISGLPLIFRGAKGTGPFTGFNTGGPKHRFPGIPSFEKFGDPSNPDGLRHRILSLLEECLRTIQSEFDYDLQDPEVKMIASIMMNGSEKFCRELFVYMADTYQEFLGCFGDPDTTWDFVCQCIEKVLTTEFQEAKSLATGMDFTDSEFSIKMIWCSMNICAVQEKFLEVGIANHPVLSSTISRYLIKNTNAGNVDSIRERVASHTATIASLESTIAELTNQVRSATSLADKANNALKKLKVDDGKNKKN